MNVQIRPSLTDDIPTIVTGCRDPSVLRLKYSARKSMIISVNVLKMRRNVGLA
jgi:hypothetical protein